MLAEENELKYAVPGGLIGVGTKIDPTLCRADRLVGQVITFSLYYYYITLFLCVIHLLIVIVGIGRGRQVARYLHRT